MRSPVALYAAKSLPALDEGVSGRDERQLSDAERIAKIKSIFGMK